ncbi:proteasome endopeptidase complex beta subunit [Laetiporus sulphureus 93-53]|uniref:Proteasome subunit beta n=1 Tax=Laetiporus sulphureus 93-53 TaxID=1314785 RepID=A0A165BTV9_9APHY|nr:proteasome endopeptidase complex beta subunit [Laetiporus sulphureus 93-53]KZT01641.1 proteasome endopeptidase complex beta subunit [Laetiporus sulphureus 93-53]
MDHFPTNWGRPRNEMYDQYNTFPLHHRPSHHKDAFADGVQHTQQPIVTGTSVLAIRYKDGIMMAADNLASYGSLARFRNIQRLHPVGSSTVVGASGDMSDFQYIQHTLDELMVEEFTYGDGHELGPAEVHEYLSRVMYGRRSKMDPLWNALLVGGIQDGKPYLAFVDLLGTTYSAPSIATGYGAHIAIPLLRTSVDPNPDAITEDQGRKILDDCMRVLYYRDARSIDKYQVATVTSAGVSISEPQKLTTEWSFAEQIRGYGAQTQ